MHQVLDAQFIPIISIEGYSCKQNVNQSKSHHAPVKCSRTRCVILSYQGWQKLMQAGALYNEFNERYTYVQLSERSQLDGRTISRLLSGEIKVDKNTIRSFFRAFNLSLEAGDYSTCGSESTNDMILAPSTYAMVAIQRAEFEQIVAELTQLKQRLGEYDRLFHRLSLKESHDSFSLSVPM